MLVPAERNVDTLHQRFREDLPDGVSLTIRRIGTPERWLHAKRPQSGTDLSFEQREAIETARRLGYYDHPRKVTMEDVAAELDLPLTTLRYRLRRAEAWATATALGRVQIGADDPITLERTDAVSESVALVDDDR